MYLGLALSSLSVNGRPATFSQDFRVAWADSHVRQLDGGRAIQLTLDQSSGCGFASKNQYLFGRVSMKIKLVPGDSAGTMISDSFNIRDELDFEFLGNGRDSPTPFKPMCTPTVKVTRSNGSISGSTPLLISTLTPSFGTITTSCKFSVDEVPIRVYKNNEGRGIPYPKFQPMGVYSTLWEADDWATRGGLEKINWSKAPFYAYYKDFDIEGCQVPGPATCASNPRNWWRAQPISS
ncbi:hypothetical protein SASPL_157280 [Salvia splendens]|uniref:GH16 domain-containing protein n=1 Tax=Salvia splendens TaxID=180675 RepID=A0A8X8VVA7_SALSN|nr:hypothetical protein SASPL_157280 [Salvia splendens]